MKKTLFLTLLCLTTTANAMNKKDLTITIYNDNRALINDVRSADLSMGVNTLSFSDISAQIMPETALLTGNNLSVIEQNFDYDLLDKTSLYKKSIGSDVIVRDINPATGIKTEKKATLLAYNNATSVLKINNQIMTMDTNNILFSRIPDNLILHPTLSLKINADNQGAQDLNLSYLTTGLSWQANYIASLNKNEDSLNLNGFITLSNHSGSAYKTAKIQLVAGDLHLVHQARPMYDGVMLEARSYKTNAMPVQEKVADYQLYTLPFKTDILAQQTKQVALLTQKNIPIQKEYVFNNINPTTREIKNINPDIQLKFKNTTHILPKGVIRVYKKSSTDSNIFMGEDTVYHTPLDKQVDLKMGKAFDIYANAKRTTYKKLSDKISESGYSYIFTNASDDDKTITLYQNFYGDFDLISQSHKSIKTTSNQIKWVLSIPAHQSITLTYKVRTNHD